MDFDSLMDLNVARASENHCFFSPTHGCDDQNFEPVAREGDKRKVYTSAKLETTSKAASDQ